MKRTSRIAFVTILLATTLAVGSCASGISQEQYDELNEALTSALTSAQSQLADMAALAAEKAAENEDLTQQNDTLASEIESLKADNKELSQQNDVIMSQIEELQDENEALRSEHDAIMEQLEKTATQITTGEVEQALFELINTARSNNGLPVLAWGENLYKTAMSNNKLMVTNMRLEEPVTVPYQEALWATGYNSAEAMAEAVLLIWQHGYHYEYDFLNAFIIYGAVAVYKSGEIYYITYVSSEWS